MFVNHRDIFKAPEGFEINKNDLKFEHSCRLEWKKCEQVHLLHLE